MICFIHIPKTAGTSFYDIVKSNYYCFLKPKVENDLGDYFESHLQQDSAIRLPGGYQTAPECLNYISKMSDDQLNKIEFIGGHIGYGLHKIVEAKVSYLSFCREPTERLISDFKEHHKKGRFFYNELMKSNFDFEHYLELLLKFNLDNILTRQIAGPHDFFLKENLSIDELYNKALLNCSNIDFIDIKDFSKSSVYFKKKYNWNKFKNVKKNISKPNQVKIDISNKMINKVINYDLMLFKKIKKIEFENNFFLAKIAKFLNEIDKF